MGEFFAELKQRHIYRMAAAYAVVAWLLVQLVNNLAPIFELPPWIARALVLLLIVGFPITLLIAWMRELPSAESTSTRAPTGKLDWALIGALVVVIALVSYQQVAPSSGTRVAPAPPAAGGISIAVLPFANVSGDASQEFFSDGMTDEIITALTKVSALRVVGRESAFQFKGQKPDMRAVSQALGASYLIEGSVRKAGERVRISAQLTRADNGVNLWAESYDRELKDIFATQSDIAQAIASALRVPLGLKQGETLVSSRTNDEPTYEDYLRAKALLRVGALKPLTDAIALLEQVVARDPGFAPGWALLAEAYSLLPGSSIERRRSPVEEARAFAQSALNKGEEAAREAIRLDSRNAVAYAALARIQTLRSNRVAGEDLFKQALALDSSQPEVLANYIITLAITGRVKEALSLGEKLRTLEPLVSNYTRLTISVLQVAGESKTTIPILQAMPTGPGRNLLLAQAYAVEGRFSEAADTLLAITASDEVERRSVEDAARLLRSVPAKVAPEALPALERLDFVYAYVGALDRVMEPWERNRQIQIGVPVTMWLPLYAPLRKTERFKAILRGAGLVDYWRARGWPEFCHPVGADDFVCD